MMAVCFARSRPPGRVTPLGMNLAEPNNYTAEHAFINLWRYSPRDLVPITNGNWDTGGPVVQNADGYPTNISMPTFHAAASIQLTKSVPASTQFTITWSGPSNGVVVDSSTSGGANTLLWTKTEAEVQSILLRIQANGVSNIVIRRTADTIGSSNFRQPFLDRCKRYSVLRFMEWGQTNDPTAVSWATRTQPTTRCQGDLLRGVSHEWMIDLCNETGCGGWFCLHHTSDQTYAEGLADLILSRRVGNWPVYIEHSNEVWNGIFPALAYLEAQPSENFLAEHVIRTKAIGGWMRARGLQLNLVLGMQSANWDMGLWYFINSPSRYNLDGIDSIAIAPYFGNNAHMSPVVETITSVQTALDACDDHIDGGITDQITNWLSICNNPLVRKQLIGYEGGQHLQRFGNLTMSDWFAEANRNTQMYDLTLKWIRLWNRLTNGALMVYYSSIYYDTVYNWPVGMVNNENGTWGAMTYEGQPINNTTGNAVKMAALVDFMAEVKQ